MKGLNDHTTKTSTSPRNVEGATYEMSCPEPFSTGRPVSDLSIKQFFTKGIPDRTTWEGREGTTELLKGNKLVR